MNLSCPSCGSLIDGPESDVGGDVCCVRCRRVVGMPSSKPKRITQIAPISQQFEEGLGALLKSLDEPAPPPPTAVTTAVAVPLARPVEKQATPIVAMPVNVPPRNIVQPTNPYTPTNLAPGRSYLARMHAQTAVHLLRFGAAILIAGFLVEVGIVLILSELQFTARAVRFAVPAGLIQFVPAVVILMSAEALNKKRYRGLVMVGAVLSLLFGATMIVGSAGLMFYGLRYCPFFIPALLAAGFSLIYIFGGYRAMNALSDPEFQAAFDRGRGPNL